MRIRPRIVIDTNVLVSAILFANSTSRQAFSRAVQKGRLLMSHALRNEIVTVLARRKFDRYILIEDRCKFVEELDSVTELIFILDMVHACRDPKDNMILELAINGKADFILTGDQDLLTLSSFQGIPIWTPAQDLSQ